MPEEREQMIRGGGVGELTGGFWIQRRSYSRPAAAARRVLSAEENKENIRPESCRRSRPRNSPLPAWYPRTPLRDITAVVNALERRRIRLREAAAQQRNLGSENSPQLSLSTSPLPQELSVSIQTPSNQAPPADASASTTTAEIVISPSPSEHPLQVSSTPNLISPTEYPLKTTSTPIFPPTGCLLHATSTPTNLITNTLNLTDPDKKLWSIIDDIERAVMENLKRTAKKPSKRTTQRSILMSMR